MDVWRIAGLILLIGPVVWTLANNELVLWGVVFIWGGAVGSMYTLATLQAGHDYNGDLLMRAIAGVASMYTLGSMIGPTLGGAMLSLWSPHGLTAVILALVLAGLGFRWLADRSTTKDTARTKIRQQLLGLGLILALATWMGGRAEPAAQAQPSATYLPALLTNAAPTTPGAITVETLATSAGEARSYRLHVPALPAGQSVPLVISIHGLNSTAEQQESVSQFSPKADQNGFIVAYPDSINGTWRFVDAAPTAPDLVFIRELITAVSARYPVDAKRIYANGISNGAQMSHRLACSLGDTLAAVGFVAGGYFRRFDCPGSTPQPTVIFHGTADSVLPYDGNVTLLPVAEFAASWAARNACTSGPTQTFSNGGVTGQTWTACSANADVVFYTTDKGHSWPGSAMPAAITTQDINATDVLLAFFFTHARP